MIGRERELAELLRLLSTARDGTATTVVLRGEAGIGKSTLITALRREAARTGFQTLTGTGVQSETSIGMAGLHQLLHAAVDRVGGLPPQQRDALRSAFGIGPDVTPDRLLLSVAVLSLLEDIAAAAPLLLVLEDVHWMDEPTLGMLSFAARRLGPAPILLVASCRSDLPNPFEPLRMPELTLGRLPDDVATRLLAEVNPALGPELRARVLDEAEGNPLAVVELGRGLAERGPSEPAGLVSRLPLPERLETSFAAQVARLPEPTRDLLLLAAANTEPALGELAAAAGRRGLGLDALAPAEQAGLISAVGDEIRFRHPLIRSAVYAAAGPALRTAAHRTLADSLADQPRAAWHRSAATTGVDERIAADLDRAATTLMARGDVGSAMRSWRRAAELSGDGEHRASRLARAAEAARQAGFNATAQDLAASAAQSSADPVVLARTGLTQNVLALTTGVIIRDPLDLGSIARAAAAAGPSPAETGVPLALLMNTAILCSAHAASDGVRRRVLADLDAVAPDADLPHTAAIRALLDPARHGQAALARLRDTPPPAHPLEALSLGLGAEPAHDWVTAAGFHRSAVDRARADGQVGDLATAAVTLGRALAAQGRLSEALAVAEEGRRLAEDLDERLLIALADAVVAHLHAWRGDSAGLAAALDRSRSLGSSARIDITLWQRWSAGLADLGAGRHFNAYVHLGAVSDVAGLGLFAIADLAEAACRGGYAEQFGERLAAARRFAGSFDSPLVRMLLLRAEALLTEDEGLFTAALEVPGAGDYPLQVARTRLVYGEWLRRQRRIGAARTALNGASAAFRAAGAQPWADRAESELAAAGVAATAPAELPTAVLTTQELQIARLAARGLTNKEIADQLFLSHRTVGTHLYRIYPKLGITGRTALREAIADQA
ncbi:helix-turn-helix transcriptional regulator [Actinoplanes rectilineatus]|uniref:helix-turn-helix transcriptional regulator n=1 Tax=Actinoplanes rectilineatus TaxID=113571 RepID=UPI000697BCE6|nr:LuxR family transcriptional regulator [Actinoplanes rectilineatus]